MAVVAGSAVDAAEESLAAAVSFGFLDFFVEPDSEAVAPDVSAATVSDFELFFDFFAGVESPDVAPVVDAVVSSADFFFFDDFVDEAAPVEAPAADVSEELALLLPFFEDFDFELFDDAVELSSDAAVPDFVDFFFFVELDVD